MRRKRPLCRCPAARDNLAHRPSAARRIVDLHAPNPPFEHAAAIGALSPSLTFVRGAAQGMAQARGAGNCLCNCGTASVAIGGSGHPRPAWRATQCARAPCAPWPPYPGGRASRPRLCGNSVRQHHSRNNVRRLPTCDNSVPTETDGYLLKWEAVLAGIAKSGFSHSLGPILPVERARTRHGGFPQTSRSCLPQRTGPGNVIDGGLRGR